MQIVQLIQQYTNQAMSYELTVTSSSNDFETISIDFLEACFIY